MKKHKSLLKILFCILLSLPIDSFGLNDPTRPPLQIIVSKQATVAEPIKVLSAVFVSRTKRIAIINGKTYRIGQKIGQFIITAINPYSVELSGPDDTKEILKLVSPIKRRSIYKDPCLNG